ncbi:quinoprotein dehydrogenase-associated SoxYZ-like carrier [Pontibaca salina]|uniref:quinoprotein dehydrogenase-associated SoxYZ-like carrier n=1 Tax=Pontibaca salina TaxID=2795731 RepID=UPI002FCDA25F
MLALSASGVFAADKSVENPLIESPTWIELRDDIVGDVTLQDGTGLFTVDAPYRAFDAATVPISIIQTDTDAVITQADIVIDENPAPLAARMSFGTGMSPLKLELRVRVNTYSNIRVIAQTDQGSFMQGRYVKASGGCSAPATKDPKAALKGIGQMRLKPIANALPASGQRREAQIMIRHPNYSGFQRDQITHLFMNAHFIDRLDVYQGDDLLFTLDGGISISENPVFRFEYTDNGAPALRIRAEDTEGNVFEEMLDKGTSS